MEYVGGSGKNLESLNDLNGKNNNERYSGNTSRKIIGKIIRKNS